MHFEQILLEVTFFSSSYKYCQSLQQKQRRKGEACRTVPTCFFFFFFFLVELINLISNDTIMGFYLSCIVKKF